MISLQSTITCPQCGHAATETMPVNSCQVRHSCTHCSHVMRPKAGDCCVFCSYGSVPCPPIQEEQAMGVASHCCSPVAPGNCLA